MKYWQKIVALSCILLHSQLTFAQLPKGKFLQDSMHIGQPIQFAFSYLHSPSDEIFFPDSSYNFSPFELKKKVVFPTTTTAKGSLDSVIYELVCYSTQPTQHLRLPIFQLIQQDSLVIYSRTDTITLRQLVADSLTNARVLSDKQLISVEYATDYWRYIRKSLTALLIGILFYSLFAKTIQRKYYAFVFRKRHRDFTSDFKRWMREFEQPKILNEALIAWKQHLQWLEKKPFSSFTTKEIIENIPNERLGEALREIDMAIYGGLMSPQMPFALNKLLEVANEIFKQRFDEYKEQLRSKSKK